MSLLVEKEQMMLSPTMMTYAGEETVGLSVMLIKIHELQELMSKYEYDMNLLSYSLKHLMREVSGLEHLQIFNYIFRSNEFLIVTDLEPAKQKRLAVQLLDCLKNQTTSPVTIAVSEKLYSIESIHNGYVQSISVLMTRPYTKDSIILFCKNEKEMTDHPIHNRVTSEVERQLIGLLKAGNQKAVLEYIQNKVGLKNCATLFRDYLEVKQTTKRITTILMEYLLLESANEKAARELEELDQMLDKGLEKLDADLLCELIGEMLQIVCADKKSEITGNVRDIVKEAVSYIDENYYEELTLASLAEKYCVESSYFSRIFKQEIGDNLMLYITQKRVDKAKELMRQTDINMAEIAFMVGYDDYTYFSKVFKKVTGKSPREYRTCL